MVKPWDGWLFVPGGSGAKDMEGQGVQEVSSSQRLSKKLRML